MTLKNPSQVELYGEILTDIQQYRFDVNQIAPLVDGEYQDLAQTIRLVRLGVLDTQEGQTARERIIQTHLHIVLRAARKFSAEQEKWNWFLDFIQEGNQALVELVSEYPFEDDQEIGGLVYKRAWWAMLAFLYNKTKTIHVPDSSYRYARSQGKTSEDLASTQPMSLEQERLNRGKKRDESGVSLGDILAEPCHSVAKCPTCVRELLHTILQHLPKREWEVMSLHFGLNEDECCFSWEEIAEQLGITLSLVRSYERKALLHMQALCEAYIVHTGHLNFIASEQAIAFFQHYQVPAFQAPPLKKEVTQHLDSVSFKLEQEGMKITVKGLALKAHINTTLVGQYLRERVQRMEMRSVEKGA